MSTIDLHLHSNYSDGSDSIAELIVNLQKQKIKTFALTDHDTYEGCIETAKKIPKNINFIKGIELTCTLQGIKCHLLGYGYDFNNVNLKNLIEKGKKLRRQKLETRIQYLKDIWNIEFTEEENHWLYSRRSVVKTHLAQILVKRGLAKTNVEAMAKYLDACKTGNTRFDGQEAIAVLKNAGGIVVWAHPLGGEGEAHLSEEYFLQKFEIMKNNGIQGLECFYSRYNQKESEILYKCAVKNSLYITCGSDYHGTNKENIQIGQLNVNNLDIDETKISILKKFGL